MGSGAGGTYSYSASYDANVRLTSLSLSRTSDSSVLFRSQRGYDAVGNVTAVNTTLADGSDNQAFCYDEQNRLVWGGSTGTPSCGASLTPGSLTGANYTQPFGYDTLDRLTNGPLGSYTYGDSAHLHGATSIGSAYTSKYDALGDMTCRAPTSTTTCAGTPTGAMLGYDNEGRLSAWQDKPTSPTTTDAFLYDGVGQRVAQQVTVGGSITTTTVYVGGMEEIMTTSSGSTLTKYFGAPGLPTTMRVGTSGPLSYLASDGLGSVSEALDSSGGVTSEQLYSPYGTARYTTGFSPTSLGYTGQRADGATGLDYYQARYYDPVAGQFTSADSVADGLNRYGYVKGNPTTTTDPSGHMACSVDFGACAAPTQYTGHRREITPGPKAGSGTTGGIKSPKPKEDRSKGSKGGKGGKGGSDGGKGCPGSCSPLDQSGGSESQCDQLCHIQNAQNIAATAGWTLFKAWVAVGAILVVMGVVSWLLEQAAAASIELPWDAAITAALSVILKGEIGVLAPLEFQLTALSGAFGAVSSLGASWWSVKDNVVDFTNFVTAVSVVMNTIYAVLTVVLQTVTKIPGGGAMAYIPLLTSYAATFASVWATDVTKSASAQILSELGYA